MQETLEAKIVKVRNILNIENLNVPEYQRPYKWKEKTANILFEDIYKAYKEDKKEYRIGTVILHYKQEDNNYNIVDGQQRLITLTILKYLLDERIQNLGLRDIELKTENSILKSKFNLLSQNAIIQNYAILKNKVSNLNKKELLEYTRYLLDNCEVVKFVTYSIQEAFQFFDSQNSRGKELVAHDLLKATHLREANFKNDEEKYKCVELWQNIKEEELKTFFEDNLYPLIMWHKNKAGIAQSRQEIIDNFRGISSNYSYNYVTYHKAINEYIEQIQIGEKIKVCKFQLTEPFIAGSDFFEYVLHYYKTFTKINEKMKEKYEEYCDKTKGNGNLYIKNLFINIIIFFIDRFGEESIEEEDRLDVLFNWAYSLRIIMQAVYKETINKYALGKREILNFRKNMFELISQMNEPDEIKYIRLDQISRQNIKIDQDKYSKLIGHLQEKGIINE